MPTPKKRVKKGRTIKGWIAFNRGEDGLSDIENVSFYNDKRTAVKYWGKRQVIKPVLIQIIEE